MLSILGETLTIFSRTVKSCPRGACQLYIVQDKGCRRKAKVRKGREEQNEICTDIGKNRMVAFERLFRTVKK